MIRRKKYLHIRLTYVDIERDRFVEFAGAAFPESVARARFADMPESPGSYILADLFDPDGGHFDEEKEVSRALCMHLLGEPIEPLIEAGHRRIDDVEVELRERRKADAAEAAR